MYSSNNSNIPSPINSISNILWYQTLYINAGDNIDLEYIDIFDEAGIISFLTVNDKIDNTRTRSPYAMGDPYINTIRGNLYKLPDKDMIIELFNNKELRINSEISKYPENDGTKYDHMYFMKYVYVDFNGCELVIDMFNHGNYFTYNDDNDMVKIDQLPNGLPNGFEFVDYDQVAHLDNTNIPIDKVNSSVIKIKTSKLGNIYLRIIYIPQNKDYINDFVILSENLLFTDAIGAMINKNQVKYLTSLRG